MTALENIQNISETDCAVDLLLQEVQKSKCNDCGKCIFGYEGVTQLGMILKDAVEKKGKSTDLALMQELCGLMETQSICDDGAEIAQAVLFALEKHEEEMIAHIGKKSCKAGVCKKFLSYYILPDLCDGCNECADVCEDDAILGKKRFIHVIDQEECIQCGLCLSACPKKAIIIAGAVKPRVPKKPIPVKRK